MGLKNGIGKLTPGCVKFTGGGPTIDFNFLSGSLPPSITFTRSSTAWEFNSAGLLTSVGNNIPRFDYGTPGSTTLQGLLIEGSSTNQALNSRDLTQVSWVKTTATAVLNQVGIDGSANSASSLTATAGNALCLQTISQTAANSVYSVYVKRITGTGTIQLTQDGGSTFATISVTSSWQRFPLPAQSTLNPVFGLRIVTNGDVIAVDVNQFEAGAFATSPIVTTSGSVTRAADSAAVSSIPWFNPVQGTFITTFIPAPIIKSFQIPTAFDDGTGNNRLYQVLSDGNNADLQLAHGGAFTSTGNLSAIPNAVNVFGVSYLSGNNSAALNGVLFSPGTAGGSVLPSGINILILGGDLGTDYLYGWLQSFVYFKTARPVGT